MPTELWAIVRKIKSPIIYILGGGSTIVPPEKENYMSEMMRRSWLLVPMSKPELIAQAARSGADAIVLDLVG